MIFFSGFFSKRGKSCTIEIGHVLFCAMVTAEPWLGNCFFGLCQAWGKALTGAYRRHSSLRRPLSSQHLVVWFSMASSQLFHISCRMNSGLQLPESHTLANAVDKILRKKEVVPINSSCSCFKRSFENVLPDS